MGVENGNGFELIDDESLINEKMMKIEASSNEHVEKQVEIKAVLSSLIQLQKQCQDFDIDLLKLPYGNSYNFVINETHQLEIEMKVSGGGDQNFDTSQIQELGNFLVTALNHINEVELDYEGKHWVSLEKDSDILGGFLGKIGMNENFLVTEQVQEIFHNKLYDANKIIKKIYTFIQEIKKGPTNVNTFIGEKNT